MVTLFLKAVEVLTIVFLTGCVIATYPVMHEVKEKSKGWVAIGMLSEVALMLLLSVKLITG